MRTAAWTAWATLAALAVLAPSAAVTASSSPVVASPGSLVVWPGVGLVGCGSGDESWPPIGDACWYPLDLLREPGPVSIYRERADGREWTTVEVGEYAYPVQRITLEDDSRVELSAGALERVRREQRLIAPLWSRRGPVRFTLPLGDPLAEMPAGGRFGHRRFFNDQPRSPHSGADYAAVTGEPVRAAAAGTVALAGDFFFSGLSVFVDHGDGLVTMYFHLSELEVATGDEVAREQRIGRVGATGRATGPHLHFGARWRGARVDPASLLSARDRVVEIR